MIDCIKCFETSLDKAAKYYFPSKAIILFTYNVWVKSVEGKVRIWLNGTSTQKCYFVPRMIKYLTSCVNYRFLFV